MRVTAENKPFIVTALASTFKPTIHILHLLDISGSMSGKKLSAAKEGMISELNLLSFDSSVNYVYSVITFSGWQAIKTIINKVQLTPNPGDLYDIINGIKATDMTAMYDAIGANLPTYIEYASSNTKVLVKIFTDGHDNDSRMYNSNTVRDMIETANTKGVIVTFVGTDTDVLNVQTRLNIKKGNTLAYDGTGAGLKRSYDIANQATVLYSKSVVDGTSDALTANFFDSKIK